MPINFSPVTDNNLLPFAQDGAVSGPDFDISNIFVDGFQFGTENVTHLSVSPRGSVYFYTNDVRSDVIITPFDSGSWRPDSTVENSVLGLKKTGIV